MLLWVNVEETLQSSISFPLHSSFQVPRMVEGLMSHHCSQVAAAKDHTVVLTEEGYVYTFGLNTFHQLGLTPPPASAHVPKQVRGTTEANEINQWHFVVHVVKNLCIQNEIWLFWWMKWQCLRMLCFVQHKIAYVIDKTFYKCVENYPQHEFQNLLNSAHFSFSVVITYCVCRCSPRCWRAGQWLELQLEGSTQCCGPERLSTQWDSTEASWVRLNI